MTFNFLFHTDLNEIKYQGQFYGMFNWVHSFSPIFLLSFLLSLLFTRIKRDQYSDEAWSKEKDSLIHSNNTHPSHACLSSHVSNRTKRDISKCMFINRFHCILSKRTRNSSFSHLEIIIILSSFSNNESIRDTFIRGSDLHAWLNYKRILWFIFIIHQSFPFRLSSLLLLLSSIERFLRSWNIFFLYFVFFYWWIRFESMPLPSMTITAKYQHVVTSIT